MPKTVNKALKIFIIELKIYANINYLNARFWKFNIVINTEVEISQQVKGNDCNTGQLPHV